jgi:hypothetical protein
VEIRVGFLNDPSLYDVPYIGNWLWHEYVELNAIDFSKTDKKRNVYDYTFHHWEQRSWVYDSLLVRYEDYENPIWFLVDWDDDGIHWYIAYFTGGPFDLTLVNPSVDTVEILQNHTFTIRWIAPEGARQTCSLYIDLSTNGGSTWQHITDTIPYNNGYEKLDMGKYDWLVPNVTSNNCYLRFIAWDRADNHDTLISHRFGIDCYKPKAQFYADKYSGELPLTVHFYDQSTHYPTSWSWNFGDGDTSTAQNLTHIFLKSSYFL